MGKERNKDDKDKELNISSALFSEAKRDRERREQKENEGKRVLEV